MATKIRLQRHGRKGYAYYHVVVADSRSPRDGRCIERLGTYNPNTEPATIELNFERSLYWIQVGAQPTDTALTILKREGVMLKNHLLGGVKKGAFDEATAEKKFEDWKQSKESSLNQHVEKIKSDKALAEKKRFEAETEKSKARAAAIAKKLAEEKLSQQESEVAEVAEQPVAEQPIENAAE